MAWSGLWDACCRSNGVEAPAAGLLSEKLNKVKDEPSGTLGHGDCFFLGPELAFEARALHSCPPPRPSPAALPPLMRRRDLGGWRLGEESGGCASAPGSGTAHPSVPEGEAVAFQTARC